MAETHMTHFTLGKGYGQELTDMLREKAWYDCDEPAAIVMATDMLHGITNDQAREVIHGVKKLKTSEKDDTLSFVDDTWTPPDFEGMKEEILKMLELFPYKSKIARRTIYTGGMWYERINEIKRGGLRREAKTIIKVMNINIWEAYEQAKLFKERCEWEEEEIRKEDDAMAEDWGIEDDARMVIGRRKHKRNNTLLDLQNDMLVRIATSDMDEEAKRSMIMASKGINDAEIHGVSIIEDNDFGFDTGWLSPDGKYYGCEYGQHIFLAQELANKFGKTIENVFIPGKMDEETWLEDNGWEKCGARKWYLCSPMTKEQKATFSRWKGKWGEPLEYNEID